MRRLQVNRMVLPLVMTVAVPPIGCRGPDGKVDWELTSRNAESFANVFDSFARTGIDIATNIEDYRNAKRELELAEEQEENEQFARLIEAMNR